MRVIGSAHTAVPEVQLLSNGRYHVMVTNAGGGSTRWKDLGRKREVYASHGIATYWVVDPDRRELIVLSLRDGAYVETDRGSRLDLTLPYPVVVDLS